MVMSPRIEDSGAVKVRGFRGRAAGVQSCCPTKTDRDPTPEIADRLGAPCSPAPVHRTNSVFCFLVPTTSLQCLLES